MFVRIQEINMFTLFGKKNSRQIFFYLLEDFSNEIFILSHGSTCTLVIYLTHMWVCILREYLLGWFSLYRWQLFDVTGRLDFQPNIIPDFFLYFKWHTSKFWTPVDEFVVGTYLPDGVGIHLISSTSLPIHFWDYFSSGLYLVHVFGCLLKQNSSLFMLLINFIFIFGIGLEWHSIVVWERL